jgi:hypothetical protein
MRAEERAVLDRHALRDEDERLHLHVLAELRRAADLDEGADVAPVADLAAVEVDELRMVDPHALTKLDVVGNHAVRILSEAGP